MRCAASASDRPRGNARDLAGPSPAQRWSERRRIATTVLFLDRGIPVAWGRTRNIGLEGVYVETAWPDMTREDAELEVEFSLSPPFDDPGAVHRLPVAIARATRDGMGLRFTRFDLRVFRILQRLIYELPAQPVARAITGTAHVTPLPVR